MLYLQVQCYRLYWVQIINEESWVFCFVLFLFVCLMFVGVFLGGFVVVVFFVWGYVLFSVF